MVQDDCLKLFGLSYWAILALPGFTFALPLHCPRCVLAWPSLCLRFAFALPLLWFCLQNREVMGGPRGYTLKLFQKSVAAATAAVAWGP